MTSYTEGPHPAQFILSEAEGQRSRDNVTIPAATTFLPGTVLDMAAGTIWLGGVAPAGGLCIAIYGIATAAGETGAVSVISREAEVNRHAMSWPAGFDDSDIDAAAVQLAKQMIIVRGQAIPPASPIAFEAGPASP